MGHLPILKRILIKCQGDFDVRGTSYDFFSRSHSFVNAQVIGAKLHILQ